MSKFFKPIGVPFWHILGENKTSLCGSVNFNPHFNVLHDQIPSDVLNVTPCLDCERALKSGVNAPDEFKQLVRKMREAQNRYFRTRTQAALRESKQFEALVDAALKPKEPGLFDTAERILET